VAGGISWLRVVSILLLEVHLHGARRPFWSSDGFTGLLQRFRAAPWGASFAFELSEVYKLLFCYGSRPWHLYQCRKFQQVICNSDIKLAALRIAVLLRCNAKLIPGLDVYPQDFKIRWGASELGIILWLTKWYGPFLASLKLKRL